MGTIIFFLKEAFRGIYEAKLMTVISIISIGVSLFLMGAMIIAFLNVETVFRKVTDQADLAAYLKDDYTTDSAVKDELIKRIRTLPSVKRVVYIDKDSAWRRFSSLYGSELLEAVDDNPLPASVEIYLSENSRSQREAKKLANAIGQFSEIESVRYSREWIEVVTRFRLISWIVALVLAGVVNFILYFMISNTIKLTIYARKDLIKNMQLVGATPFFIKMPFLLEGIIQGIIGGILCVVFIGIVRLLLLRFPLFWGPDFLPLIIVLVGVVYGWVGSAGAVRKFLA